jgi:hypothetical protein
MAQIKLRRDTYQNWYTYNPILADGEPSYDSTNNKIKVGNGILHWRALPYLTDIGSVFPSNSVGFLSNDGLGNLSWISDNDTAYLTTETDPVFTAWNKSTGISITESQISDLKDYSIDNTPSNVYYVDPNSNIMNPSGSMSNPFHTIADAMDAAILKNNDSTNPIFIWLLSNITEDVVLTRGGIFLTGIGAGNVGSVTLYGTITVDSSSTIITSNVFSITNITITAPTNGIGVFFTGINSQSLKLSDVMIHVTGSGYGVKADNTGSNSILQIESTLFSHDGTTHCINGIAGHIYLKKIHTVTSSAHAIIISGSTYMKMSDSVITATIDINGGTLLVNDCDITNTPSLTTTSHGFSLLTSNSTLVIINSLIGISTIGSVDTRAIYGVAGSSVLYHSLAFYNPYAIDQITGYNNLISTEIGAGLQPLPTTLVSA